MIATETEAANQSGTGVAARVFSRDGAKGIANAVAPMTAATEAGD